jgi:hypothetical protein
MSKIKGGLSRALIVMARIFINSTIYHLCSQTGAQGIKILVEILYLHAFEIKTRTS